MKELPLDKWRAYLLSQARGGDPSPPHHGARSLTLSRETGSGAHLIGEMVMKILESDQPGGKPWVMFDRSLARRALTDAFLPESLEPYVPEDARNRVTEVIEELLGSHPPSWTLVQRTNQTIQRLAQAGNVILVGRGAHLVTAHLPHVLHVRIVAPLEFRVSHVMERLQFTPLHAAEYVRKGDLAKARYIRRNFESRVQDPLQFHLTINTGRVSIPTAAKIIAGILAAPP